jgi:hypothetical protein
LDGWNRRDAETRAASFVDAAGCINGQHVRNRPVILEGRQRLFETICSMPFALRRRRPPGIVD